MALSGLASVHLPKLPPSIMCPPWCTGLAQPSSPPNSVQCPHVGRSIQPVWEYLHPRDQQILHTEVTRLRRAVAEHYCRCPEPVNPDSLKMQPFPVLGPSRWWSAPPGAFCSVASCSAGLSFEGGTHPRLGHLSLHPGKMPTARGGLP